MPFSFRYAIRYGSIDFARIVYYPQILHFCHVTMEEMFREVVGVTYASTLQDENVGYPTVRSEADFAHPIPYGEVLTLSMETLRLGNSSVHFLYRGVRSDGVEAYRVKNVQVAVDLEAWNSVPIPDRHRRAFESLGA